MPNSKKKTKRGGKNKQQQQGRVETFSGAELCQFPNAANAATLSLIPSNTQFNQRLNNMADIFMFFRFTWIEIEFFTTTGTGVYGYIPGDSNSLPDTQGEIISLEPSAICHLGQTIPVRMVIGRKMLVGSAINKWFKTTVNGAVQSIDEIQGYICCNVSGATPTVNVVFRYTCEFTGWAGTANIPKPLKPKISDPSDAEEVHLRAEMTLAKREAAIALLKDLGIEVPTALSSIWQFSGFSPSDK